MESIKKYNRMIGIKSYGYTLFFLTVLYCLRLINNFTSICKQLSLSNGVRRCLTVRPKKNKWIGYIVALIILVIAITKFNSFGGLRFEQILFFLILPFTLTRAGCSYKPLLYGIMGVVFILAFYITNVYSIFYFGVCCAVFSCLSITNHRPTLLSLGLALITTPAIKYMFSVFSFPLRLKLTGVAGQILSQFMQHISVAGNCIHVNGISFTVAPECLGLNMISSALVFAIFVLAFFTKKFKKRPRFAFVLIFMMLAFVLVVLTNMTRILLTVVLEAMPGNALHELIGVFLFVVNCCLPLFVMGMYSQRFYKSHSAVFASFKQRYMLSIFLFPLLVMGSYGVEQNLLNASFDSTSVSITGFNKRESHDGVLKFINDSALIYVKPPAFMLGSDHNPFICWRGSGYEIKNELIRQVGEHAVYTFELHRSGAAPLYSCWWYSNGVANSISQFQWRMAMFRRESPYSLVNVTTDNKDHTIALSLQLLKMNIFE